MRFIPTRVGNTPRGAHRPAGRPVHPHACGEYVSVEPSVIVWFGSSPRVWGIRLRRDHRGALARFIPTRVGNTVPSPGRRPGRSVHPHACGEYAVQHVAGSGPDGSSPRVWGIRSYRVRLARRWRFIPTRVGNTIQGTGSGSVISVHPHACGEYIFTRSMPMESVGSSPRVWGIRHIGFASRAKGRFIPTRVGNTARPCACPPACAVHPHACGEYSSGRCKK